MEVTITYQSEHGTVPAPKTVELNEWLFANGYGMQSPKIFGLTGKKEGFAEYLVYCMYNERVVGIKSEHPFLKALDMGSGEYALYIDEDSWAIAQTNEQITCSVRNPQALPITPAYYTGSFSLSDIPFAGKALYLCVDGHGNLSWRNYILDNSFFQLLWCTSITKNYSAFNSMIPTESVFEIEYVESSEPQEQIYILTAEDLPTLESEGYIFKGWAGYENELGNSILSPGDFVDGDTSEYTLTAVWEADAPATVDYTITYSTDRGTAPEAKTVTVNEGESYTLTEADLPTLEAEGYDFIGWWPSDGLKVEVGDTISADTTLYAYWQKSTVKYEISYQSAYGTPPASKTVTVDYGEAYALTAEDLPILTAEGYIFGRWTIDGVIANVGDPITADTMLVAVWEKASPGWDWDSFVQGFIAGQALRRFL